MGSAARVQRELIGRAQPYVGEPVLAAAYFGWPVSWETKSSARSHPELAGGFPAVVLVAITDTELYFLAPEVNPVTHETKREGTSDVIGCWPRSQARVARLSGVRRLVGNELPSLPVVRFELPGREPAQLVGAQSATPAFLRMLTDAPAGPEADDTTNGAISAPRSYGELAARIESELRELCLWGSAEPSEPVRGAFGAPDMTFARWLEHVLCPRLRAIADGSSEPPRESHVAAAAARELDGVEGTQTLIDTLAALDSLTQQ